MVFYVYQLKVEEAKTLAMKVLQTFPKSKNGNHYLRCKTGEKIFFKIFLKKYGINEEDVKYKSIDVLRRIRMIESFPYYLQSYDMHFDLLKNGQEYYTIQTHFFIFVAIQTKNLQYELLNFYPK